MLDKRDLRRSEYKCQLSHLPTGPLSPNLSFPGWQVERSEVAWARQMLGEGYNESRCTDTLSLWVCLYSVGDPAYSKNCSCCWPVLLARTCLPFNFLTRETLPSRVTHMSLAPQDSLPEFCVFFVQLDIPISLTSSHRIYHNAPQRLLACLGSTKLFSINHCKHQASWEVP